MKRLIIDSYTKIAFGFNSKIYKQIDGVPVVPPLVPVFGSIVMTELDKIIVKVLVEKSLV